MERKLGAIPLSADILAQSNIGLWAFELDEGSAPRMYVDEAMLKLLGLKKQLSPEETYHAWYDNIDPLHYDEVHASVEKMGAGQHSEVQYPWHAPDGSIMIVRCGGIRNPNYTKGLRIEGVHRDVTNLVHYEKEKDEELARKSILLEHEKLRTDALTFLADMEPDPIEFVDFFAERLLILSGCDQVIYRSITGNKCQKNAPGIKDVPETTCRQCPYSKPLDQVYKNEIVELPSCHNCENPVAAKCPVKSVYIKSVKLNGKVLGVLALHYINKEHVITDNGRETLNMFSSMLSLAFSNIEARKGKEDYQRQRLVTAANVIEAFCKNYTTVYSVNIDNDKYTAYKIKKEISEKYTENGERFSKAMKKYISSEVVKIDQKLVLSQLDYKTVIKRLLNEGSYDIEYRAMVDDDIKWHKMTLSAMPSGNEILVGFVENDSDIIINHVEDVIQNEYFGIYVVDLIRDVVKTVKKSKYYSKDIKSECYSKAFMEFTVGLEEEDVEFFSKLCNPHFIQQAFMNENKREYVYYSYRTKAWTKLTTYVLSRDDKNIPLSVVHCFSNIDSLQKKNQELSIDLKKEIEENKERQAHLEESLTFTNFFLGTYNAAFYVDLNDHTSRIYKASTETINDNFIVEDYYKSLCERVDHGVKPAERKQLKEIFSPQYLLEALKKEKEIRCTFTDSSFEKPRIILFHAIRGADQYHAAIGFKDMTAETEAEQTYANTVMSLSENFQAIYDADADTGKYTVYSENNAFADKVSNELVNGQDIFEDMLRDIEKIIYKDDRHLFRETFTREVIKKLIKNDSEITFDYRILVKGEPQWYKLKIVKSNLKKNHFLTGIFNVNNERAKEKEFSKVLSGLTSEFSSLFHVDAATGTFKVYMREDEVEILKIIDNCGSNYQALLKLMTENFVHKEDKEKFIHYSELRYLKRILSSKKSEHFYFRRLVGKEYKWFEQVIVKVQDESEKLEEFIIYFVDRDKEVREEQENKRQLQEALGMAQSANRAKTTFLNNMSHDIRTPMNAIIGYAGLAASHIDNKEQVQDYLSKIGQSSDHLLSLINDVLDMSRIESGKMNINEKKENLSDIIHGLRDIIQADIHAKQLDLYIDSCDVNDEDVICDKLRLNQVLLNVLSNAIKYTPAGGNVSMRIKELTVKKNGYASYQFTVKDTGIGMTEEFLKTIFDPFTRMKSSTVSGIQGTGLGMAITKNIVDMMGGKIDITSHLSRGTEVVMEFDFKLQKNAKEPVKIAELEGLKGLVVDDDANSCASISGMLKDVGMRGEWCTSGKEAVFRAGLAYKDGDPFKVFIIDWLMPDMNGIETARRIRKTVGDEIPIIILTAYDWSDIEDEAKEAGVTGFVSKPMFPSDLRKVLNKCLGKEEDGKSKKKKKKEIDLAGKKILLVDDNEYNREIAVEILEDYQITVTTANDGVEAVEKMKQAKKGDYDLVLMDVQMPVMNGYQATREIRALVTDISKIPILAMTANAFEEDKKLALEAGMNEHITKPIKIDVLKNILEKFIK